MILKAAALAAVVLFGAAPAFAQNPFPLPDPFKPQQPTTPATVPSLPPLPIPLNNLPIPLTGPTGKPVSIQQLVTSIEGISQADITAAEVSAKSGGDTVALNCFAALGSLITNLQAGNTQTLPKIHLVTTFEGVRLIAVSLRPGSPFSTACAPLAEEVKTDVLALVSQIAGGALTLSSFGL